MKDDTISRAAAIDALNVSMIFGRCNEKTVTFDALKKYAEGVRERIDALPSAQPNIIACGDCKHWICHDRRCGYWNHGVKPLDWCCHAERRNDG